MQLGYGGRDIHTSWAVDKAHHWGAMTIVGQNLHGFCGDSAARRKNPGKTWQKPWGRAGS